MKLRPKSSSCPEREGLCAATLRDALPFNNLFVLRGTWPAPAEPAPPGVHQMSGDG
jgi:hypothetical protein